MKRMVLAERISVNAIRIKDMEKAENTGPKFVVCNSNSEFPASLELHKIYRVLPDEEAAQEGDIRIIDESGEDYLYPAEWFVAIEVPSDIEASLLRL